jgi:pilus assembly protein CpaE
MAEAAEDKIRILIVDDIPETRENLKKLLFFEQDMEVVGTASSGREAVELASTLRPDVVLMDINMPDMDGLTAAKEMLGKALGVQVIMMSVQGELSYVRESMRAGAREFLIKPFTSDELITSLRHVYELRPLVTAAVSGVPQGFGLDIFGQEALANGKVIAVFSAKGGVGCSTIATNLACVLKAKHGNKVALWDTSFQFGDIAVMLNLQPTRTIVDFLPQIDELDDELLNEVMLTHASGVRALLAPPEPQHADSIRPYHLETIIDVMRQSYDFIVIDTWTSLYDQMLTVLDAADCIVLLLSPDIPTVKNTRLFFDVAERLGYPPEKNVLVLNKWDRRSGIRPEKVQGAFNHSLDGLIPLDVRTVMNSVNQGIPFVLNGKTSPISQSLVELAEHLVQVLLPESEQSIEVVERPEVQTHSGRLGRLTR